MGLSKGWDHYEATARSLSYRNDINDIYSNSWGYINFYQSNIGYMHKRIKKALKDNAEKVRKLFIYRIEYGLIWIEYDLIKMDFIFDRIEFDQK